MCVAGWTACHTASFIHWYLNLLLPKFTKNTPKHNIICDRDFAQLDRQLIKHPLIGSIAVSGMVCFINNKTPEYMESQMKKNTKWFNEPF